MRRVAVRRDRLRWLRMWQEAQKIVAADPDDPFGELTDVAATAAEIGTHRRGTASFRRMLRGPTLG